MRNHNNQSPVHLPRLSITYYSSVPINSPWTLNYFRKILPPGHALLGSGRLTFLDIFASWTLKRNLDAFGKVQQYKNDIMCPFYGSNQFFINK